VNHANDSTAGYFEEEPAVVLVHESLPLESVHREQERFHRLPVPCGSNQHGTSVQPYANRWTDVQHVIVDR